MKFLAAEIICLLKTGTHDVDKNLNKLREMANGDLWCKAFCDHIGFGKKFKAKEASEFQNEILEYETLVTLL